MARSRPIGSGPNKSKQTGRGRQAVLRQARKKTSQIQVLIPHTWNNLNWNLGIMLIKKGRFKEGWPLFEHGLQVSAAEPQRWQRSLKKPFTPAEVPFWRGEELKGKRLLLLGEHGIGDSMMFATLIPRLQKRALKRIPGDRLISIYRRSLPDIKVLSSEDLLKGHCSIDFDLQVPLGPSVNTDSLRFLTMTTARLAQGHPVQTAQLRQLQRRETFGGNQLARRRKSGPDSQEIVETQ